MSTKAGFKKKEKAVGGSRRIVVKIITVSISILALFITYKVFTKSIDVTVNEIPVVQVKKNNSIIVYEMIGKDNVEEYKIIEADYKDGMILWENVEEEAFDKYAAYFIRKDTVLFKDQLIDERPPIYPPLENLDDDFEFLTFPYNSSEAGGNILRPGDRVRIRITYEAEKMISANDENPNSRSSTEKYLQTDIIFESIVITDMLNSNNNSVYMIYQEAMRYDEKQRQEMMKSSDFLSAVKPKSLQLAATADDVENYANVKAKKGEILVTILRREEGTIDWGFNLPILETEVGTWTEEVK
ncbi:MAG: hypothetical protein LBB91_00650 [Clostridiales bacterium]|jgi:hypothetical protein|nr:hypothetical protein [Clostridiales bacterium]